MLQHLQKPAVQMGLLAVVVAGAAGAYYLTKQQPTAANAPKTEAKTGGGVGTMAVEEKKVELGSKRTAQTGAQSGLGSNVQPLDLPARKEKAPTVSSLTSTPKKTKDKPPPLPKLVHVANMSPEPFIPSAPKVFAPRGLLLKAALVITVDSSSLETPVLALITEDVYWQGKLILPAGTQVQAQASQGRTRDRIEVKGNFTFVWADGREYNLACVALDHERLSDGSYGITDGSAGIRGQIIKNDQYAEVKILIAEALEGIMNNKQDQFQSVYGLVPQNSSRNAALGGGSQAASSYSQMLTKKLDQDLDFVRVAAGTQFYIYTRDVFEPELASVAGLRQKGQALSSWQLAEQSYQNATAEHAAANQRTALSAADAEKARQKEQSDEQMERVQGLMAPASDSTPAADAAIPVVSPTSSSQP